ncbi:MAG: hypothetical protein KF753_13305 [Caldilineaceae bacterium]|nr:hypothetical protein [Caldilineaceae bacterium]
MTKTTAPSAADWNRLYELMAQVKALAPWQWMYESDVFVVRDPQSHEYYFVSVMGNLGEHLCVAVYLGMRAYTRLLEFAAAGGARGTGEELLEIRHLQASFEDREQLTAQDRDTIKELGLKFRGKMAWPLFRSYLAGYAPWHLNAEEARILRLALEQLLDVATRFEADEVDIPDDNKRFLVRVQDEKGEWTDQVMPVPPPAPESISVDILAAKAESVRRLRRSRNIFEADLLMMPGTVGERGERPQFAYIFLVVDSQSGMILAGETLHVTSTFGEMLARIPELMVDICLKMQGVPGEIHVNNERLEWLLSSLSSLMDCKIKQTGRLRALETARHAMLQFFMH